MKEIHYDRFVDTMAAIVLNLCILYIASDMNLLLFVDDDSMLCFQVSCTQACSVGDAGDRRRSKGAPEVATVASSTGRRGIGGDKQV